LGCYTSVMTPMTEIRNRLEDLLDGAEGFAASVLFDFGEAGAIHIDGSGGKIKLSSERHAASCTIAMPAETFVHILAGELDETAAFMQGEMRIQGEVRLATEVSDFIRKRAQERTVTP